MSTNNYQIVKELDTRYAIALGFCADGDPDDVYDNVEDARSQNEGRTPSVGFVVIDRQTGEWADFAMQAFASMRVLCSATTNTWSSRTWFPLCC